MAWSDQSLSSITIPGDAADTDARVYIGPDSPIAETIGLPAAITLFGTTDPITGNSTSYVIGVEDHADGSGVLVINSLYSGPLVPPGGTKEILRVVRVADHEEIYLGWFEPDTSIGIDASLELHLSSATDVKIQSDLLSIVGYAADNDVELYLGGNPNDMGRGIVVAANNTASTGLITAETVQLTTNSVTYSEDRAYRVDIAGGAAQTTAGPTGWADYRLRKGTTVAGASLGELYRFPASSAGTVYAIQGSKVFITGPTAVTTPISLTLQCVTGTVRSFAGTGGTSFDMTITDIGPASLYPNAAVLT